MNKIPATPTSPLTFIDKKTGSVYKLTRKFLGEIFTKNTIERNELKAYLKGRTRYAYKKNEYGDQLFYPVRQEYFYIQTS